MSKQRVKYKKKVKINFEELLLEKVQANPGLYNKEAKEYKNVLVKERIWKKIADELVCDGKILF